jgi:hypothetical protein
MYMDRKTGMSYDGMKHQWKMKTKHSSNNNNNNNNNNNSINGFQCNNVSFAFTVLFWVCVCYINIIYHRRSSVPYCFTKTVVDSHLHRASLVSVV